MSLLIGPLFILEASARFTSRTCWIESPTYCVTRSANDGAWCYYPTEGLPYGTISTSCLDDGERHGSSTFAFVMENHLKQNVSIAYYSAGSDATFLGGPDWPVPSGGGPVRLCLSGLGGDGIYRTSCTTVSADNTLPDSNEVSWCSVNIAQPDLQDGCYPAPASPTHTSPFQDQTSRPTSTASTASTSSTTTASTSAAQGAPPLATIPGDPVSDADQGPSNNTRKGYQACKLCHVLSAIILGFILQ